MEIKEIIASFMKGNSKASISEKQKFWLLGQAKRDGLAVASNNVFILFEIFVVKIRYCGNTVLCVGDSCTTHWEGNGEMRVLGFHWDYDQPIRVIRLRDSAQFYMQPSDLIAYT